MKMLVEAVKNLNIYEAAKARTSDQPYLRRRSWAYITSVPTAASVKILPTNSPDCCVVESVNSKPLPRWQPSEDDLLADDWETVG